jgi:hypothetical protein
LGGGTTPLPIIYYVPFHKDYIQMSLFLGSPKTRTLTVPKLWTFISFSNQFFLKTIVGAIFITLEISFQRCITHSNWTSVHPCFKGFVVGSLIPNLTLTPSFDHNSCKSGLNEEFEGILSM